MKKQRQSNIELLRIVAMLMVLTLHANFMGIGKPDPEDIMVSPLQSSIQILIQALCIIGVDVFVMISGWFQIKPSFKGFCNFLWQVFFIIGISYAVSSTVFGESLGIKDCLKCFGLFDGGGWFVAAYMGLYILSPVLNAFIQLSSLKQHTVLVGAFYLFQTIFGETISTSFIVMGYSTFSFVGLYLLAALLRRLDFGITKRLCLITILCCIVLNSTAFIISSVLNLIGIRDIIFNYINPLVIVQASATLIYFSKLNIKRNFTGNIIKFVAASCFAAYLFHVGTPMAANLYHNTIVFLWHEYTNIIAFLLISGFILAVFVCAIVIDQPRKLIWQQLILRFFK